MIKTTIEYPDFEKLDIRVGKVIAASAPEWSYKLLQFTVDFGEEIGIKTILSGVAKWYQPEMLVNKQFAFIVNLAERKMGEGVSQGMMLMAVAAEKPILIEVDAVVPVGTVVR